MAKTFPILSPRIANWQGEVTRTFVEDSESMISDGNGPGQTSRGNRDSRNLLNPCALKFSPSNRAAPSALNRNSNQGELDGGLNADALAQLDVSMQRQKWRLKASFLMNCTHLLYRRRERDGVLCLKCVGLMERIQSKDAGIVTTYTEKTYLLWLQDNRRAGNIAMEVLTFER